MRKADGKNYSYVYDILVSPPEGMAESDSYSIMRSEIVRAIKFGENAVNKSTCINDLRCYALDCNIDPDTFTDEGFELDLEDEDDE